MQADLDYGRWLWTAAREVRLKVTWMLASKRVIDVEDKFWSEWSLEVFSIAIITIFFILRKNI